MKYVLEFGNRGGAHVDNIIVPSLKLAQTLARSLVISYTNDPHANGATRSDWEFSRGIVRATWLNTDGFVAVSKLDGTPRGPASATLWRKGATLFEHTVNYYMSHEC